MPLRIVRRQLFKFKYIEQQVKISRPTINLSINKNVQNVMITPMSYP